MNYHIATVQWYIYMHDMRSMQVIWYVHLRGSCHGMVVDGGYMFLMDPDMSTFPRVTWHCPKYRWLFIGGSGDFVKTRGVSQKHPSMQLRETHTKLKCV